MDRISLIHLYTKKKEKIKPVKPFITDNITKLNLIVNMLREFHLYTVVETMAFMQYSGLDLNLVLELYVAAAGGSKILSREGRILLDEFANRAVSRG